MIHVHQLPAENMNFINDSQNPNRILILLVVYVCFASLGGYIDDDTDMAFVLFQGYLKIIIKITKLNKNYKYFTAYLISINIFGTELVNRGSFLGFAIGSHFSDEGINQI